MPTQRRKASGSAKPTPAKRWPTLDEAIAAAARSAGGEHVATWTYRDGSDTRDLMHVARFNLPDGSKQFRPIHHDGGGFVLGDPPGLLPLYRLPELQGASRVYVCEGEKAADAAHSIGLIATASAHGSKSAAKADWQPLAGKDVVILPDADEAGEHYAESVAAILHRLGCAVRIVRLPDLTPGSGEDIADYIAARECVESETIRSQIETLAASAPTWQPPADEGGGACVPIIVRLADVKPEPLRWLWPGRIALGKLTMLAGDPGLGKSSLTIDIAARLSRETPWPDATSEHNSAGGTVLLTAEDDLADTIRPRLDAAGADVSRIIAMQAVRHGNGAARMFNLALDLPALDAAIRQCDGCRLVVIDPITAYMGKTDSHKNADVRALLAPLGELAAKHRVAIVGVSHLNKGGAGSAMYRTMGSLAFVAAARAAWVVACDRDDHTRRLLLPVKNNLAPNTGGLAFTLRQAENGMPTLAWDARPVNVSADEVLALQGHDEERSAREEAAEWLRELLAGGPVKSTDAQKQAREAGIKESTLNRAKRVTGVVTKRDGFGPGSTWYWMLPDHRWPAGPIDCQQRDVTIYGERDNLWRDEGDAA